jgi:hypothetical protein
MKWVRCPCSNGDYCSYNVPGECVVYRDRSPAYIRLKRNNSKMRQTISWDEWRKLANNGRYDSEGWYWYPDVSATK